MTAGETVPCGLCGKPTMMTGTKRCDACWELEGRIHRDPALARRILAECDPTLPGGVTKKTLIQALQDSGMVYDAGGGIMKPSVREDMDLTQEIDELYAALSTHHAAPGAPQQEASGAHYLTDAQITGLHEVALRIFNAPGATQTTKDVIEWFIRILRVQADGASRAAATAPAGGVTEQSAEESSDGRHEQLRFDVHGGVPVGASSDGTLSAKQVSSLTDKLWNSAEVMSLNAELGLTMDQLVSLVNAVLPLTTAAQPTAPAGGVTDEQWRASKYGQEAAKLADDYLALNAEVVALREQVAALTTAARAAEPEPCRPDILERLTYHAYERDDLTIDECWSVLAEGWKKVHGRTERQMVMQIIGLIAASPTPPTGTSQGEGEK